MNSVRKTGSQDSGPSIKEYIDSVIAGLINTDQIHEGLPGGQAQVMSVCRSFSFALIESEPLFRFAKTTDGRRSVYRAITRAVKVGLSLNPQEGKACILPYKDNSGSIIRVNYQIMKAGLISLAFSSGIITAIDTEALHANDTLEIVKTSKGSDYTYKPALSKRGAIIGYFAMCKFKANNESKITYMSVEEIDEHKRKYSRSSMIPEVSYGKKTVLKALLRDLPLDSVLTGIHAEESDDYKVTAPEIDEKTATEKATKKIKNPGRAASDDISPEPAASGADEEEIRMKFAPDAIF